MRDKIKSNLKLIEKLEQETCDLLLLEIEILARYIIAKNPKKVSGFMMAMGSFCFIDIKDEVMWDHVSEKLIGYSKLYKLIYENDDRFKLTGCGMKFKYNEPIITDW